MTFNKRLDEDAEALLPIIQDCSVAMLKNGGVQFTALDTGHVPLDADVFLMDNSNTRKEGVGRTYHNYDGYAPIAAYLGLEGWNLEIELRPGSQHSQEGFMALWYFPGLVFYFNFKKLSCFLRLLLNDFLTLL